MKRSRQNAAFAAQAPAPGGGAGPPRDPRPRRRRKKRSARAWFIIFLLVVGFGTLGASTAVGVLLGYISRLPPIEKLEEYNPPQTSVVLARDDKRLIGEFAEERRQLATIDEIPLKLQQAYMAAEDERFRFHYGVDLKSIMRSFRRNMEAGGASEGASTITMQLPRNLGELGREKSYKRKINEALLAFQIEQRYSKDQILEFYMNHNELGYPNYGVRAAAQAYFSKDLKDLTIAECASIAAMPKNPNLWNPVTHPKRNSERRDQILSRMRTLGWINGAEYQVAVESKLTTRPAKRRSNVANSEFPYYVDALKRHLAAFYGVGEKEINRNGYIIHSSVDPRMQEIAQEELTKGLKEAEAMWLDARSLSDPGGPPKQGEARVAHIVDRPTTFTLNVELDDYKGVLTFPNYLPYHNPQNVLRKGNRIAVVIDDVDPKRRTFTAGPGDKSCIQGSVTILNARNCEVLALVGGANFFDNGNDGQYNRAAQGGKPAGSTIKPLFYAAAMERGFPPQYVIYDGPVDYGGYAPRNYEKTHFGNTTLLEGLQKSRNVVMVELFNRAGVKPTMQRVLRFDYTTGDRAWRDRFPMVLPICLGAVDMNTLEITAAYSVFTNQGVGQRPQFFKSITDLKGNPMIQPDPDPQIVLDPITAFQLVYMLRQVVTGGTASSTVGKDLPSPPYPPICGKTGTTDDNTDAWFTGFTPDIIMSVYVGFDTRKSLGTKMTGGRVAGPIWSGIFKRIFTTREDWTMAFEPPPGVTYANISKGGYAVPGDLTGEDIYERVPYAIGKAPGSSRSRSAPSDSEPAGPARTGPALLPSSVDPNAGAAGTFNDLNRR